MWSLGVNATPVGESGVSYTGMSELFGWDNQEWLNDATRSAVQLQELFNKVKAERTGR